MEEQANAIIQYFAAIWQFFELESPFFGLTFKQIYFGIFIVGFSISIIVSLFDTSAPSMEQKADTERRIVRTRMWNTFWNHRN